GEAWGNLYLTDKPTEFTMEDEEAVVVLAEWASVAIANARAHTSERQRRSSVEVMNRALETTTEITRALGGETDVDGVLELIARRSGALVGARSTQISMLEGDEFVITAVAGEGMSGLKGQRVRVDESIAAKALRSGQPQRYDEIPRSTYAHQHIGARRAIVTP